MATQAERITALEVKVGAQTAEIHSMNKKQDELLSLKDKGAGAFYLASAIFGTVIVGLINLALSYIKGT